MFWRSVRNACIAALPAIAVLFGLTLDHTLDLSLSIFIGFAVIGGVMVVMITQEIKIKYFEHKLDEMLQDLGDSMPGQLRQSIDTKLQALQDSWGDTMQHMENRLRARLAILEHVPNPLIMLDKKLVCVRANITARELLGSVLENKPISSILRQADVLEAVQFVLDNNESRSLEFTMGLTGSNMESHYLLLAEPIQDQPGTRTRIILSLHDMTQLKNAERLHADFVAYASHELRTPLTSILGFIETLQGPAKQDQKAQQHFLSIMHDQAARMSRLIGDLLSLSRIERNMHVPTADIISIKPLLEDVVASLQLNAEAKNMIVHLTWPPDSAVQVIGHADELAQLFQNLLDNAIKYGEADTAITINITEKNQHWAMAFTNHGDGIAAEDIPKLTERFYRTISARTAPGTGLGLAIVKNIVEHHHGQLEITSQPGNHSTFTVHLPMVP